MKHYAKGSRSERELAKMLWVWGFAVIRSAGSARLRYSAPDIVAIKNRNVFAFECKARKNYVYLKADEVSELREWCSRAGAKGYLAWKISNRGWWFLDVNSIVQGVSMSEILKKGIRVEDIASKC